jgi:hypothetical protein
VGSLAGIGGGQAGAGAVSVIRASTGLTPDGVDPAATGSRRARDVPDGRSSPHCTAAPTGINPPHTEHRARIDTLTIFAGSIRKTDRHSGQETFIENEDWEEWAFQDEDYRV